MVILNTYTLDKDKYHRISFCVILGAAFTVDSLSFFFLLEAVSLYTKIYKISHNKPGKSCRHRRDKRKVSDLLVIVDEARVEGVKVKDKREKDGHAVHYPSG